MLTYVFSLLALLTCGSLCWNSYCVRVHHRRPYSLLASIARLGKTSRTVSFVITDNHHFLTEDKQKNKLHSHVAFQFRSFFCGFALPCCCCVALPVVFFQLMPQVVTFSPKPYTTLLSDDPLTYDIFL